MEYETLDKYDQLYGSMKEVGLFTKPSTVQSVQFLTGKTETYIVETCRHEDGDTIFVQRIDDQRTVTRMALPPKVARLIAAQADALTKRRRSIASKETMKTRMEAGTWKGFKK